MMISKIKLLFYMIIMFVFGFLAHRFITMMPQNKEHQTIQPSHVNQNTTVITNQNDTNLPKQNKHRKLNEEENQQLIQAAQNTLRSLRQSLYTYMNMDSSGWLPSEPIALRKMLKQTNYFHYSTLKKHFTEFGYKLINDNGYGVSGKFVLVGRAKDSNATYIWISDNNVIGTTDDTNLSGIPCAKDNL